MMRRDMPTLLPTWSLLCFVTAIAGALLAGLAALILWLGTLVGIIGAAFTVCLLCLVVAWLCYLFSLRATFRRIEEQMESVSYAATLIERAYAWLGGKESLLLRIFDRLLDRVLPVK
jgi:hypothetical protein